MRVQSIPLGPQTTNRILFDNFVFVHMYVQGMQRAAKLSVPHACAVTPC